MEVDDYLETIDKLEVQVRIMKDIKERDEQLLRYLSFNSEIWLEN